MFGANLLLPTSLAVSPPPVRGVRRKKRNGPRVSPFLTATFNKWHGFSQWSVLGPSHPRPPGNTLQSPGYFLGASETQGRGTPEAPLPGGTGTLWPAGRPTPHPSHPCISFPGPLPPDSRLPASSPPQVFGVCGISIPCLLFMKGKRSVCRILSGSSSFGGRAANPPTSAAYVILVPGSPIPGPLPTSALAQPPTPSELQALRCKGRE